MPLHVEEERMERGEMLDRLAKDPEFTYSGPVFETREQTRSAALEEAARLCVSQKGTFAAGTSTGSSRCVRCAAAIRALKADHIGDAAVMVSRDIAESLRHYLATKMYSKGGFVMETHRAEADGMDDELSALNEALGRKTWASPSK